MSLAIESNDLKQETSSRRSSHTRSSRRKNRDGIA